MSAHPDNPDALRLDAAQRAIIRRALMDRIAALHRLVDQLRHEFGGGVAQLLEEAQRVGAVLDAVGRAG